MVNNLKDLKTVLSGTVGGHFLVSKCDFKAFKNKPGNFFSCLLSDRYGAVNAIMWDDKCRSWIKNSAVVSVTGEIAQYNDAPQVVIKMIEAAIEGTYDKTQLIPSLPLDQIDKMMAELMEIRETITNKACKEVWSSIASKEGLKDPVSWFSLFITCPGGIGDVHHNYCGGLFEHSLSMIKMAEVMVKKYALDRDILLTGCLIHDIGKTLSYKWNAAFEMTDEGRLLHHTILGYSILNVLLDDHTDPDYLKLAHIIISHHENECMRKPMTAEAQAVATLDTADAMVMFALDYSNRPENSNDSNWTKYCQLTGRQYYIPEPPKQ